MQPMRVNKQKEQPTNTKTITKANGIVEPRWVASHFVGKRQEMVQQMQPAAFA